MRALFGLDPDREPARGTDAAGLFERALSFYASEYTSRFLRGPLTPWARLQGAARRLDGVIYGEIARRRATGERGEDVLSLLLDAHDEEGDVAERRQVRDEVMTLLFAGHDTTTSTVSFMFYELARAPEIAERLVAEQDEVLRGAAPRAEQLMGGELPQLELVLEETLRKYPPAWVGPRRSVEPFEFEGHAVPGGAYVNYCSWASHHLPDVFAEPERFRPERFAPDAQRGAPEGRVHPLRRRLADVHRDALRAARGPDDRDADPEPLRAGAAGGLRARDPPDADDQPARGPAAAACASARAPLSAASRAASARSRLPRRAAGCGAERDGLHGEARVGEQRDPREAREREPLGLGHELAFLRAEQREHGGADAEEAAADAHLDGAGGAFDELRPATPAGSALCRSACVRVPCAASSSPRFSALHVAHPQGAQLEAFGGHVDVLDPVAILGSSPSNWETLMRRSPARTVADSRVAPQQLDRGERVQADAAHGAVLADLIARDPGRDRGQRELRERRARPRSLRPRRARSGWPCRGGDACP